MIWTDLYKYYWIDPLVQAPDLRHNYPFLCLEFDPIVSRHSTYKFNHLSLQRHKANIIICISIYYLLSSLYYESVSTCNPHSFINSNLSETNYDFNVCFKNIVDLKIKWIIKLFKIKDWWIVKFVLNYLKFQSNMLIDKSIRMLFWHRRPCGRNLASGYNTILLRLILGDLNS